MRSQLPTLELDAVFEAKEDLALAVKNALLDIMTEVCILRYSKALGNQSVGHPNLMVDLAYPFAIFLLLRCI
jgi:hypothetical protein